MIPLFIQQLKAGKNLTVTNPEMTRFMMSLQDSVSLVRYAFHNAQQGDLFIRKAKSCTIGNLAQAVINLFESDAKIDIIGSRHAEKVSEALASREELSRAEDHKEYFRIPADSRELNYELYYEQGDRTRHFFQDYDSHTVERMSVAETEELLLTLPEVRFELQQAGLAPLERKAS